MSPGSHFTGGVVVGGWSVLLTPERLPKTAIESSKNKIVTVPNCRKLRKLDLFSPPNKLAIDKLMMLDFILLGTEMHSEAI